MSALRPLPGRGSADYRALMARHPISEQVHAQAAEILAMVRRDGDVAIRQLTERFDGVRLPTTRVASERMAAALTSMNASLRWALEEAARRIERVHRAQAFREGRVEVLPGIEVWREWRPFRRVGLYAPGGRTVYPSSVLMMAIPARIAGCEQIVLCSPPQANGQPASPMLAAAAMAGVTEIHAVGGAQAIGALAYGTETIERVDKIVGPGNPWVTAAKMQVFGEVAIDMPAGPSEVVVISDGSAERSWINADLRAQAEHSPDALAILLTTSEPDAAAVDDLSEPQVLAFRCRDLEEALRFANDFAPEHLTLACAEPERWLPRVTNAGSIFLGRDAPAAAGDYATGANHVLPTGGSARSFSGLGLDAFGHTVQVQAITAEGIAAIAPVSDALAAAEALPWHARSVQMRFGADSRADQRG